MNTQTPAEMMQKIRSLIGDRKALAANSIEHAAAINKNRAERAALSEEIKALVPQWAQAKKAEAKALKPVVVKAPKVPKVKKPAAEAEQTVG